MSINEVFLSFCYFDNIKSSILGAHKISPHDPKAHHWSKWTFPSLKLILPLLCLHWPTQYIFLDFCSLQLIALTTCLYSVQFSSVAQLCPTLCDPMKRSTPGHPVHHQLPGYTQTYVHCVGDAIQSSHPLSSPSAPALNPSQHQGLFQWVNSSNEVAKVLEFQL